MRKIICDRCSRECNGTHGQLHLSRTQRASTTEIVADDQFDPLDLCDICTEVARTTFGFRISQGYGEQGMGGPAVAMAMEACPPPVPGWDDRVHEIRGEDVPG
jgi:hypothetical protein